MPSTGRLPGKYVLKTPFSPGPALSYVWCGARKKRNEKPTNRQKAELEA